MRWPKQDKSYRTNSLLSNSTKIVNIIAGYGYDPALASMEECVASAVKGEIV